jgi:hypothetical protein
MSEERYCTVCKQELADSEADICDQCLASIQNTKWI